MRTPIYAALIAAVALPAIPAAAQQYGDQYHQDRYNHDRDQSYDRDHRDYRDHRDDRHDRDYRRDDRYYRHDNGRHVGEWRRYRNYDYNRYEPGQSTYYADRYYRDGRYYQPRRLGRNDRIYVGSDHRYYCRRSDGTTGLIIGGLSGAVIGNSLASGGSRTLGALLGGTAGALLGQSIDRGQVVCR